MRITDKMGRAGGKRTTYGGTEIKVWLDGVVNHVAGVSTVIDLLKKLEGSRGQTREDPASSVGL